MFRYEVGKPFPFNFARGIEECRASVNGAFFDVLYYIKDPKPTDIETWRKDKIVYGVYVEAGIPFFLIDFTPANWNFDLTLNIFKVQENEIDDWLNGEGNVITLFLIDADSNILCAMRTISILSSVSEKIRDVMEKQTDVYSSSDEVDVAIQDAMQRLTTAHMITRTKMIRL